MKFCRKCGKILRKEDGVFKCCNGHIDGELTSQLIKNMKRKKEENKKKLLTFPSPEEVAVFSLKLPDYIKDKRKEEGGLVNFAESFQFYENLGRLEEQYEPDNFRYVRGNVHAKGGKDFKSGLIFIRIELIPEITEKIQGFIMADGEHFTLELLDKTVEEKREIIKILKEKMKRKL